MCGSLSIMLIQMLKSGRQPGGLPGGQPGGLLGRQGRRAWRADGGVAWQVDPALAGVSLAPLGRAPLASWSATSAVLRTPEHATPPP